ncbi:MAG: DNA polymerase I [Actinomycetota bacterium]|jgi:DNA polymerase-1|nr:DNA polymerase I [Actinomycetota bacterium]
MTKRVMAVVDGNSLLHRAFHGLPPTMTAPDGRPTNAVFGFVSMLTKMVDVLEPDGVVVAFDKGRPLFRSEVLACYKAQRPPTAPELKAQFPMIKELLTAMSVPIVEVEGWEGDDILGTLAEQGENAGMRVLLITGDRDALQLVTENVSVVTTRKGITDIVTYDPQGVFDRYGVTPAQVTDYLGLKGDTSDNIPGVPGVGEKTASKLIAEHGTLEAVLAAAPGIKGKLGERLRDHAEDARVSRTVATIRCDVPIDLDIETVKWGVFDPAVIAKAFAELRFTSLLERVLATAGEKPVVPEVEPSLPWVVLRDSDAFSRVRDWVAEGLGSWIGVGIDDGSGESLFAERRDIALAADDAVAVLSDDAIQIAFNSLLESSRVAAGDIKALLHDLCPPDSGGAACDTSFDAVHPARIFDCSLAAYLLESHRSSYDIAGLSADYLSQPLAEPTETMPRAAVEAQAVARLAPVFTQQLEADRSLDCFSRIEMPLVPVLARMERVGVSIDTDVLDGLARETAAGIDMLVAEIHEMAGLEFNIVSPKQLAEVLFEKMDLPPSKRTKTGYSTDASVLKMLAAQYPIAQLIRDYRELAKLKSTYIDALPRLLGTDGRLHTTFNQTVAATGRLSSSNPNLQNIPVRTEFGRRIRAAFVPGAFGDTIVGAYYSQIELRILAHLSGDEGLVEAFTSGADFHAATAARVFGMAVDEVTTEFRSRAKAVNFGIVYGQTAHGLGDSLGMGYSEAQGMIDRYFEAYPRVRTYLDETVAEAHKDGFASTMFGRRRRIPELKSSNYNLRSFGERTAMNHPMQGTAADIIKLSMIEVDRRLRGEGFSARMVIQVHDELVFECPSLEVGRLSAMVREAMRDVVKLAVPLEIDISSGVNWALAK